MNEEQLMAIMVTILYAQAGLPEYEAARQAKRILDAVRSVRAMEVQQ